MLSRIRLGLWVAVMAAAVVLAGCMPSGDGQGDDEKEPHFVLGKAKVNAMDYTGAIEAFEESLEADPQSAAAHFELGWLYDEKASDPAAAIYHYREYLKLEPNANNAEVIRQRIYRCKQQLAADVLPLPSTPAAQQQLEKLLEQNRQLQAQVDELNDAVKQWSAYAARLAALTNPPPVAGNPVPPPTPNLVQTPVVVASQTPASLVGYTERPTSASRPRTHTVAPGETAAAIARKYGIRLSALESANPSVNPNRIRAGQVLNIPPL